MFRTIRIQSPSVTSFASILWRNGEVGTNVGHKGKVDKMVLNFTGLSSLKYQFHLSEVVLLILSMLLGIFSCLWLDRVIKLCAGQCLLFAKLYERARILQGSFLGWCYLPTCLHLIAVLCSLCVLGFVRGGRYG